MADNNAKSNQVHVDYNIWLPIWCKCRDADAGEDAVKAKGETYLPKLDAQTDPQYNAYKLRGRFFNAFGKTLDGHIGLASRKEPIITFPPAAEPLMENVDRQGSGLEDYMKSALREILEVNRAGTLVEFTRVEEGATQAETPDARPYLVLYKAEDIRDWGYDDNNNLIYVLLRERIPMRGNRVEQGREFRYRELELLEGVYTQTVWIDGQDQAEEPIIPQVNFAPLDFIPFTIHQSEFDQQITEPVLIDLVNLCFSHYRLKADHAHALHYVALPTPWITGIDPEDKNAPKTIGPEKVWLIGPDTAKVGMLEFTGEGVAAIAAELKSMENEMAILGSRVLLPDISENTATASKLRSISETSDLASIVLTEEKQFNRILEFYLEWGGITGENGVDLPTDFMPTVMDAQMLTAMVGAWQNGAISQEILWTNLQKAEIIEADEDLDELKKAIEAEDEERMVSAAKAIAAATPAPITPDEDEDET